MDISPMIDSVLSLFIMILVGLYGGKKKIISNELNKNLTDILIKIALPFMIVTSFIFSYDEGIKSNVIQAFYYSLMAYIIMATISFLILIPVKNDKRTILHFANIFTNTGYIGFPILYSIYGAEGVIYGSIFNMFFVIFVWTYGLNLFKRRFDRKIFRKELKKVLLNPSLIAVFIGLIIMIFNIQLPNFLTSSMKSIGDITGPLSMIIIGVILSQVRIKEYLKDWHMYYGIIAKLIIIPLITYLIFTLFVDLTRVLITVIVMTAMPASAMTSIFAEIYNKEKDFAAVLVSVTTLLSLITLPLLLRIMIIT